MESELTESERQHSKLTWKLPLSKQLPLYFMARNSNLINSSVGLELQWWQLVLNLMNPWKNLERIFAKRYWMNDDLWEHWCFMSPGESIGAMMIPSFHSLDEKSFWYIYVLVFYRELMVSFFNRLNLCNLSSSQKTIMGVNFRGSDLARPKRFRWSFYSDFYRQTTDW